MFSKTASSVIELLARYRSVNYDPKKTICIFASGRGGSTWLAELFCSVPGSYLLWEPLHWKSNPISSSVGFGRSIYINPDRDEPEKLEFIKSIVCGKDISSLTNRSVHFDPIRVIFFKRYIVKFVNANMLLPWVSKRIPTQNVYMIRHPCAVVASEIRHGAWNGYKKEYARDEALFDEFPHIAKIFDRIYNVEEVLAFKWAIENFVPLAHERCASWMSVAYEELLLSGPNGARALVEHFGLDGCAAAKHFAHQSKTSVDGYETVEQRLGMWRSRLDREMARRIIRVVRDVGVDVYDESAFPIRRLRGPLKGAAI